MVFVISLVWWLSGSYSHAEIITRVPGMDNRPKMVARNDSVIIGQFFDTLDAPDEIIPGSWPRFRGADFDNISKDPLLWQNHGIHQVPPLSGKPLLVKDIQVRSCS